MIVDVHTHVLPRTWPDMADRWGAGPWPSLVHGAMGCTKLMVGDRPLRDVDARLWDMPTRLAAMDEAGIDCHVLSTVPVMFSYWAPGKAAADLGRLLNDHVADWVRERPDRFFGLGTLPMQAPDLAVAELERCVRELGLRGVQLGTHVLGRNWDDPALESVLAAAAELDAAVFIHPWDMMASERMPAWFAPWLVGMPAETALAAGSLMFGGVLDRHPALRIGLAHGGGAVPYLLGRFDRGFAARPDLCATRTTNAPSTQWTRFWVDTLVQDAASLRLLAEKSGRDRLMLGTDFPFPLGEAVPGEAIRQAWPDQPELGNHLLAENVRTFLGVTS
ncbi:MAG: amidohydrolase family protein [Candidatus Sericytochromatia bacterium]|nr:amidohydrolase family protein [Candidatus Sericytochromatia bacterium]